MATENFMLSGLNPINSEEEKINEIICPEIKQRAQII
jgi:hypothetical protein